MARILVELGFEPFAKGEGVGGRSGEADDDLALAETPHLARIALDDGLAQADLAVAGDDGLAALAHQDDGRRVHGGGPMLGRRIWTCEVAYLASGGCKPVRCYKPAHYIGAARWLQAQRSESALKIRRAAILTN